MTRTTVYLEPYGIRANFEGNEGDSTSERGADFLMQTSENGGDDGTRTRDLCRDS